MWAYLTAPDQQIDRAKQRTDAGHCELLNELTQALLTQVWTQSPRNRTINNQG